MATANSISIRIAADASGFAAGAREAMAGLDNLTGKIREHRVEQVQEGRLTRFYANEIANLGVVSQGTSKALGELTAGLATGTAIGVAIGAAKGLVEVIRESGEESKKQAEAIKENYAKVSESVGESLKKLRESFEFTFTPKSQTQKQWETLGEGVRKEIKDIQKEIDKLVAKGPGVKDFFSFMFHSDDKNQQLPIEEEIKKLQARADALLRGFESQKPAKNATEAAEQEKADREIDLSESVEEAKRAADQATLDASINASTIAATQQIADAKRVADFKKALDAEIHDAEMRNTAAEEEAERNKLGIYTTQERKADEINKAAEEAKRHSHELGEAAKEIGTSFGQEFAGVLRGTKSISDAMEDLLQVALKVAAQVALTEAILSGNPFAILGAGALFAASSIIPAALEDGGGGSNLRSNPAGTGFLSSPINITQHFHGGATPSAVSLEMERTVVNFIRRVQSRGRLT